MVTTNNTRVTRMTKRHTRVLKGKRLIIIRSSRRVIRPTSVIRPLMSRATNGNAIAGRNGRLSQLTPRLFNPNGTRDRQRHNITIANGGDVVLAFIKIQRAKGTVRLPRLNGTLTTTYRRLINVTLVTCVGRSLVHKNDRRPIRDRHRLRDARVKYRVTTNL